MRSGVSIQHRTGVRVTLSWAAVVSMSVFVAPAADPQEDRTQQVVEQAMALVPQRDNGARLYAARCARCHGANATGNAETATPAIAGQVTGYLIRQLVDIAEANRPVSEMHRLAASPELTSAQALRDVASYLSLLPRLAKPQVGDGRALALGQRVYETTCLQCHGPRAGGDAEAFVPALQGQHYSYLLMQTRQMPVSHGSHIGVETLERFEDLSLEELAAVSDYISRLKVEAGSSQVVRTDGAAPDSVAGR